MFKDDLFTFYYNVEQKPINMEYSNEDYYYRLPQIFVTKDNYMQVIERIKNLQAFK